MGFLTFEPFMDGWIHSRRVYWTSKKDCRLFVVCCCDAQLIKIWGDINTGPPVNVLKFLPLGIEFCRVSRSTDDDDPLLDCTLARDLTPTLLWT